MKEKKDFKKHLPLLCFLLGITVLWIILALRKDIWFCDEVYSMESANSGVEFWIHPLYETGNWVSGETISDYLSKGATFFNFIDIEKYLYRDHVPFYFLVLRVFSLLAYGQVSKWIGLSLDLCCFLICAVLTYRLFRKVLQSEALSACASALILLHPLLLSQATMIRMYMMLTMFTALFLNLIGWVILSGDGGKKRDAEVQVPAEDGLTPKQLLWRGFLLAGFTAAGLLTHYYFWIFVGAFSLFLGLRLLFTKRFRALFTYIASMVSSLVFATVGFPLLWKRTLFSAGGSDATGALGSLTQFSLFPVKLRLMGELFSRMLLPDPARLFSGLAIFLTVLLLGILIFALVKIRKEEGSEWILLLAGASLLDYVLVGLLTENLSDRYLYAPVYGLMLSGLCALLLLAKKKTPKKPAVPVAFFAVLLCLTCISSLREENISWLRSRPAEELKAVEALKGETWVAFFDPEDFRFHCSFYDLRLAGMVKRTTPDDTAPDPVLQAAESTVIFVFEEQYSVEDCIACIEKSSGQKVRSSEWIAHSGYMQVYRLDF